MKLRNFWDGALRTALALVVILTSAAGADTFTVTRTDDPTPDGCMPADCSLREAVIDANGNGPADTITLPPGIYIMTIPGADEDAAATGDLDVTEELIIEGAGTRVTVIDGGAIDRVFHLLDAATVVTISDLTIRNALTAGIGGGIYVRDVQLTVDRCAIVENTAGGGGGIAGEGSTLIVDSTIADNAVIGGRGGGLWQFAQTMTVVNSTISGNMATESGGGVYSSGSGTIVELRSVTITANIADSDDNGFGNGGGISILSSGSVEMTHTIVAGNFDLGGEVPDCVNSVSSPIVSGGYNLIGNRSQCAVAGDETGNLYNIDPQLSPLANNGGPTDTHALQSNSPAIDAGDPAGCEDENGAPLTADQRGGERPLDGNGDTVAVCDMGAYETGDPIFSDGFESGDTSTWSSTMP